jgi:hypothetical protein
MYNKSFVVTGRSLRVTRDLDIVPMLPASKAYCTVGSGLFLVNDDMFTRWFYPTSKALSNLSELSTNVRQSIAFYRTYQSYMERMFHSFLLPSENHNVLAYKRDMTVAVHKYLEKVHA